MEQPIKGDPATVGPPRGGPGVLTLLRTNPKSLDPRHCLPNIQDASGDIEGRQEAAGASPRRALVRLYKYVQPASIALQRVPLPPLPKYSHRIRRIDYLPAAGRRKKYVFASPKWGKTL